MVLKKDFSSFSRNLLSLLYLLISDIMGAYIVVALYLLAIYSTSLFLFFKVSTMPDGIVYLKIKALGVVYFLFFLMSAFLWWISLIRPLLRLLSLYWFLLEYDRKIILKDFLVFCVASILVVWMLFIMTSIMMSQFFLIETYVDVKDSNLLEKKVLCLSPQKPSVLATPHISFMGIKKDEPLVPPEGVPEVKIKEIVKVPLVCFLVMFVDAETGLEVPVYVFGIPKCCFVAGIDEQVLTRPIGDKVTLGAPQTLTASASVHVGARLDSRVSESDFLFMMVSAEYTKLDRGLVELGVNELYLAAKQILSSSKISSADQAGGAADTNRKLIGSPVFSDWHTFNKAFFFSPLKGYVRLSSMSSDDQRFLIDTLSAFSPEQIEKFRRIPVETRNGIISDYFAGKCGVPLPEAALKALTPKAAYPPLSEAAPPPIPERAIQTLPEDALVPSLDAVFSPEPEVVLLPSSQVSSPAISEGKSPTVSEGTSRPSIVSRLTSYISSFFPAQIQSQSNTSDDFDDMTLGEIEDHLSALEERNRRAGIEPGQDPMAQLSGPALDEYMGRKKESDDLSSSEGSDPYRKSPPKSLFDPSS